MSLATGACSSLAGATAGTQCFTATECALGLACVPKGAIRICSSNTTAIQTQIDSGMDASNPGDAGLFIFADGAPPPDTGADASGGPAPQDAGMPVIDSGKAPDTGAAPKDSGSRG